MKRSGRGLMIAIAAAGLFSSAATGLAADAAQLADSDAKVKCHGVNECKGKSACHSADNTCAGHNECKGKGWLEMTAEQCKEKGGTVIEE